MSESNNNLPETNTKRDIWWGITVIGILLFLFAITGYALEYNKDLKNVDNMVQTMIYVLITLITFRYGASKKHR